MRGTHLLPLPKRRRWEERGTGTAPCSVSASFLWGGSRQCHSQHPQRSSRRELTNPIPRDSRSTMPAWDTLLLVAHYMSFWYGGSELLPRWHSMRQPPPVRSAAGAGSGAGGSHPDLRTYPDNFWVVTFHFVQMLRAAAAGWQHSRSRSRALGGGAAAQLLGGLAPAQLALALLLLRPGAAEHMDSAAVLARPSFPPLFLFTAPLPMLGSTAHSLLLPQEACRL